MGIRSFFLEIIAAFIFWALKGFEGKLTDEMSKPDDHRSKKAIRNTILSFIILFLTYIILSNRINEEKKEKNIKPEYMYTIEVPINLETE